jgi:hypothetical protein
MRTASQRALSYSVDVSAAERIPDRSVIKSSVCVTRSFVVVPCTVYDTGENLFSDRLGYQGRYEGAQRDVSVHRRICSDLMLACRHLQPYRARGTAAQRPQSPQ